MDNVTGGLETSHRRYTEKLTEVESDLKKLGNLHASKAPLYYGPGVFWQIEAGNLSEKSLPMTRYSTSIPVSQVLGKVLKNSSDHIYLEEHFKNTSKFTIPTKVALKAFIFK